MTTDKINAHRALVDAAHEMVHAIDYNNEHPSADGSMSADAGADRFNEALDAYVEAVNAERAGKPDA